MTGQSYPTQLGMLGNGNQSSGGSGVVQSQGESSGNNNANNVGAVNQQSLQFNAIRLQSEVLELI